MTGKAAHKCPANKPRCARYQYIRHRSPLSDDICGLVPIYPLRYNARSPCQGNTANQLTALMGARNSPVFTLRRPDE
ncbi:hypothetical protein DBO95_09095 [Yersinia pestis]|nr:hypothetical protein YPPY03_2348 [Yersinia pestis PY-03]EIR65287.1 hypothetical protein YPPY25_2349 [Yersinia pestis PY-25]EIS91890.1 hypothetical protein YPPY88_2352 [Yersinia pestis PY-88]PVF13291.1 hypothetical protein DBO95_09095 [Yersinia pestis]